jgi:hypothetical protein
MNSQSRTFVKQVQVDLLALSDADLFNTIQQWVDGRTTSGQLPDTPVDTRSALGYSPLLAEAEDLSHPPIDTPDAESETPIPWQAPTPGHLRILIATMDANQFAQHVVTLAYKFFHTIYPEWYDGFVFNAHLANYLRQLRISQPAHRPDNAPLRSPDHVR